MQHNPAEQAINYPTEDGERRYSEGLAKLNKLRAIHQSLNGQQLETSAIPDSANPPAGNPTMHKNTSLETGLLEKGRARALEEYHDHQVKAEAFLILAGRYRALGLENQADAYSERGQLESAATRGFQAVIEAYEKKLDDLGVSRMPVEEPKNLNMTYRSLDSAERFLESSKSDYSICCEHTIQVLKAEETLKKLEVALLTRPLTVAEKKQYGEAAHPRDRFTRMAEREALNAAISFNHFQSEIQSAEISYDAFNRALTGKPLPEHTQILQDPAPTGSERRMNRLAVGMVVCQTLKVIDREL